MGLLGLTSDAVLGGATDLLNLGIGLIQSNHQNKVNAREAQKQRDWASGENQKNRDFTSGENQMSRDWQSGESQKAREWEEEMYNLYNSPSAMMRQYREAGLNPFLAGGSQAVGQGMGTAAPMSGSPAQASPGSVGGVAASVGNPVMPQIGSNLLQSVGVHANSANQSAQAMETKWRTAASIYEHMGKKAFDRFAKENGLFEGDPVSSLAAQAYAADILKTQSEQFRNYIESKFVQDYKGREAEARIDQFKKSLNVMDSEIMKMASEGQLNYGRLHALGAQVAKDFAQAGLFEAMSGQINELLPYLLQRAALDTGMSAMDFLSQFADFDMLEYVREWQHSDKAKAAVKRTRGMKSDVNVVGAFLDGFVSKIPAPMINNGFNSVRSGSYSGSSSTYGSWDWNMRSWHE